MNFTAYFIRRPVLASAISLFILLLGLFSIFKLPLRLYPKVDVPLINITTTYPGASADVMKNYVSTTLQNAIAGIEGVNYITATTTDGSSSIDVYLQLGTQVDTTLNAIATKLNAVRGDLPAEINDPVLRKSNADDNASLILAFSSDQWSEQQSADYLMRVIKPQLESVDGVAKADVWGDTYAMRIWLNPDLMAAYRVTAGDVSEALKKQNVQSAPGNTRGQFVKYAVNADTNLSSASEFNQIVVRQVGNAPIRIQDIGQAELDRRSDSISAFVRGKPAVMMGVYLLPGTNPLQVLRNVRAQLPEIQKHLPAGMQAQVLLDRSRNIEASLHEVLKSIAFAIVIVIGVIFLFIRKLRAVIIPIVTIPISLIGMCFFMSLLGFSLNTLTLLAMVLAIGLVVDDAIVVMENIVRHMEKGETALAAAIKGTREIALPIIAMTITLAAVYAPIGFMGGLTGFLFTEFAFTLAGAVIISGFIALTLSPMMCSKLLNTQPAIPSKHQESRFFIHINNRYQWLLQKVLQHRLSVIVVWLMICASCFYMYATIPHELAPAEDPGYLQVISSAPTFTNTDFIKQYSERLTPIYKNLSAVENFLHINGVPTDSQVMSFLPLKLWDKRKQKITTIQSELQQQLAQIPGLDSHVMIPSDLPATESIPLGFVLKSQGGYRELYLAAQKLKAVAEKSGLFLFIDADLQYDKPQLNLHVDRNATADLGIHVDELADALSLMLSGNRLQQFTMRGRTYDVILQTPQAYRANPDTLNKINLRTQSGKLVPLSNIVTMSSSIEPNGLNQFQKFNAVTLSGTMKPGHTLAEGMKFLQTQAQALLPNSINYDYVGESRQLMQEQHRILWTFSLAILVIFLVLAIQFESYRDPLIILLGSVPMAFFAGLLLLKFGLGTLNIYTQIGLLTLIGLVSKHGILLTKFANELRRHHYLPKQEAICQAASLRLRPILMTTMAMIFGAVPLLIAEGAGANSRFAIGVVITSGLLVGTVFTLLIVPVIYTFIAKVSLNDLLPVADCHPEREECKKHLI